jgi:hypothetical protein
MRSAAICWIMLGVGALTAQQPSIPIPVRSIYVKLVSTNSEPLHAIGFDAIVEALRSKGIRLAVESRFDPAAVEKAADVIRDLYGDEEQKVRVEHTATQIPPRGVEVTFEVIQLCTCN